MEKTNIEIKKYIDRMAAFGAEPNGGVTRRLYDESWKKAVFHFKEELEKEGFCSEFDQVGNLFGFIEGEQKEEIILSGSHIDTVRNGGKLDGILGILSAFVAMKSLYKEFGKPKKTMKIVAFCEEEGSRFPYSFWGSSSMLGISSSKEIKDIADEDGCLFSEAIKAAGFTYPTGPSVKAENIAAFLELHIEQGGVLEQEKLRIGIVNAITGLKRYTVTLKGEANHAGTTPMGLRKDANYAFARICYESTQKAIAEGDPLVLTFGQVAVSPNLSNVVAGETVFTIDCRTTDKDKLESFTKMLEADMKRIAHEMNVAIEIELWLEENPQPMNKDLMDMFEKICVEKGLSHKIMPSGAGHDSQVIAPYIPTAMIFVPSINGISHSPLEDTKIDDICAGIEVLKAAIYKLAY